MNKFEARRMKITFDKIDEKVPSSPGIYEVFTNDGVPLKVGISVNLRKRLKAHARSKQSRLKLQDESEPASLSNMVSKQSILAKHLYFDSSLTSEYDLTTEIGRQSFLQQCCYVLIDEKSSREEAREVERMLERSGKYRYVGRVIER